MNINVSAVWKKADKTKVPPVDPKSWQLFPYSSQTYNVNGGVPPVIDDIVTSYAIYTPHTISYVISNPRVKSSSANGSSSPLQVEITVRVLFNKSIL